MATCQFCGRPFKNTQAVRAHLKACAAYHGRDQAAASALIRQGCLSTAFRNYGDVSADRQAARVGEGALASSYL